MKKHIGTVYSTAKQITTNYFHSKSSFMRLHLCMWMTFQYFQSSSSRKDVEMAKMDSSCRWILNKADLEQVVTKENLKEKGFDQIVQISAKEQTGIEELYQLIQDIFFEGHVSFNDEIYLTNMRHKTEVSEALKSLSMVLQSIEDGMPEDFFSIDLLDAYEHLGFITGESVGEDLVNEIFAEFCMGK